MTKAAAGKMIVLNFNHQLRLRAVPTRLVFFVLQRLGPPGRLPVNPGGAISGSSFLVSSFFSLSLKLEREADVMQ